MEDCVISWVILVVVVYGFVICWLIKGFLALLKANHEEYWSHW